MKVRKLNTDIEVDLSFLVGNEVRQEYILPNCRSPNRNVVECFVPINPDDTPIKVHGNLYGSVCVGRIDLVADGTFCFDSIMEPSKDMARDRIKYYKNRTISFTEALDNPKTPAWTTKTNRLPPDSFLGTMQTKALDKNEIEILRDKEFSHVDGRHPGVGSVMVAISLSQVQLGGYAHHYRSTEFGSWKEGDPRLVYDCGIAADHKLVHVRRSDTEVKGKRSVKFRNHFEEERPGFGPFCKIIFNYRSQEAIEKAGCVLRSTEEYEELEAGDPVNFVLGKDSPGAHTKVLLGQNLGTTSSSNADDDMMSAPQRETQTADHQKEVLNLTEDHEQPEQPKKIIGGTLIIDPDWKKKHGKLGGKLGGKLILPPNRDSLIVDDYKRKEAEKKSRSHTPTNLTEEIESFGHRYNDESPTREAATKYESSVVVVRGDEDEEYAKNLFGEEELEQTAEQPWAKEWKAIGDEQETMPSELTKDEGEITEYEKDGSSGEVNNLQGQDHQQDDLDADESLDIDGGGFTVDEDTSWNFDVLEPLEEPSPRADLTGLDNSGEQLRQQQTASKSDTAGWDSNVLVPIEESLQPSESSTFHPKEEQQQQQQSTSNVEHPSLRLKVGEPSQMSSRLLESTDTARNEKQVEDPRSEQTTTMDWEASEQQDACAPPQTGLAGIPSDDYISEADLNRIPCVDTIRAAIPELGIHEETLAEIFDESGPFQNHEKAVEEFADRVKEIAMKDQTTDMYYLHEHFNTTVREPFSLEQQNLHEASADKNIESSALVIKQEDVDLASDDPSGRFTELPRTDSKQASVATQRSATTSTSAPKPKKRKSSSVLAEESPAKLRKAQIEQQIAELKAQAAAKREETAKLKKAREEKQLQREEEKRRRKEEKQQRKKQQRLDREREARVVEELVNAELERMEEDARRADEENEEELRRGQDDDNNLAESDDSSSDEGDESSDESEARTFKAEMEE